jgi:RNA polymerase sigma factor (sigma-70 family)
MESEHEAGVTRPQPGAGSMRANASAPGDAELVSRIAAGDEAALAEAYDRHAHIVYGSAMRLLHDRESAEEVVQDVYLAVWRNAGQYSPTAGSLLSWVLGIARNKTIDRVRAAARRPRLVVVGDPDDDRDEALERAPGRRRAVARWRPSVAWGPAAPRAARREDGHDQRQRHGQADGEQPAGVRERRADGDDHWWNLLSGVRPRPPRRFPLTTPIGPTTGVSIRDRSPYPV